MSSRPLVSGSNNSAAAIITPIGDGGEHANGLAEREMRAEQAHVRSSPVVSLRAAYAMVGDIGTGYRVEISTVSGRAGGSPTCF
jgi:hypothetical protein